MDGVDGGMRGMIKADVAFITISGSPFLVRLETKDRFVDAIEVCVDDDVYCYKQEDMSCLRCRQDYKLLLL